jgi:hypothetical protein
VVAIRQTRLFKVPHIFALVANRSFQVYDLPARLSRNHLSA